MWEIKTNKIELNWIELGSCNTKGFCVKMWSIKICEFHENPTAATNVNLMTANDLYIIITIYPTFVRSLLWSGTHDLFSF